MNGIGGDATLTPDYPGISDAADITSWDPPFPVDLNRVRKKDEDYWDQYRAAPKAIITVSDAQRLWGSRYGKRVVAAAVGRPHDRRASDRSRRRRLHGAQRPRRGASAPRKGTTDFGEYFLYFSFFLVVSALLLAYLFFAVGLEQRTTEVGMLASIGFSPSKIRGVFLREGAILARDRRGDRRRGGDRLQRPDPLRPAHVVGRRGRHDRSHPACRAGMAGDRRDRHADRRPRRVVARRARDEPPIGARAAQGRRRRALVAVGDRPRRSRPVCC